MNFAGRDRVAVIKWHFCVWRYFIDFSPLFFFFFFFCRCFSVRGAGGERGGGGRGAGLVDSLPYS